MGRRQVEQGFCSFFAQIFAIFDDFLKWSDLKTLQNFEKSSNMGMAKNLEKTNNFNPFLDMILMGTHNSITDTTDCFQLQESISDHVMEKYYF